MEISRVIDKIKNFFSKCFVVVLGIATVIGSVLFLKNKSDNDKTEAKRRYENDLKDLESQEKQALDNNDKKLEEKKKKLYSEKSRELKNLKKRYNNKLKKELIKNRKSRKEMASKIAKKYGAKNR